jgi:hypothetical protein
MKKITIKHIKSFKPCKSGIDSFEAKYPKFNDTLAVLLRLDEVSYNHKIWLACKIVGIKTLRQWSVECAEMVLSNYERVYPNDTRVRDCIEITKKEISGKLCKSSAESAVQSAAESAWSEAAAEAAWVAESAWSVARSVQSVRSVARSEEKEQEDLNLSILIALLENKR